MQPENTEPRQVVATRLSSQGIEAVDKARGAWTRAEYIRRATARAVKAGMKGPEVGDEHDW